MPHSAERLAAIFARTDGHCHICWKKLSLKNYASFGKRGAWEVEHSIPRANGGTDRRNNLYPAHISCNRRKQARSTRSVRAINGKTRAPRSKVAKERVRTQNTVKGAATGGVIGFAVAGPVGGLLGSLIGGGFGHDMDPQ